MPPLLSYNTHLCAPTRGMALGAAAAAAALVLRLTPLGLLRSADLAACNQLFLFPFNGLIMLIVALHDITMKS